MRDLSNNLFSYATKELSQDAFICWLCSYSLENADKTDLELVECSNNLICAFLKKRLADLDNSKIRLLEIEKQKNNIDVLLTVEYLDKKYKIIVEDKTHTSEHDKQLERYKESIDKEYEVIGIYFKTGFQSNLSGVEKAGYSYFGRKDILDILNLCTSKNVILCDYKEYWNNFEELTKYYREAPLDKWPDWQTVNGFYDEMQSILWEKQCWAEYGYVSNQSGGFWGLWYGPNDCSIVEEDNFKVILYLQVEMKWNYEKARYEYRICTKLEDQSSNKDDERVGKIRDILIEKQEPFFVKPKQLRWGAHMTIGEYDLNNENPTFDQLKNGILESIQKHRDLIDEVKKLCR